MFKGTCHCGAVEVTFDGVPARLVSCNCSVCRRLRPLWAHGPEGQIRVNAGPDATHAYIWGDKGLAFHRCRTCGVTTHWIGLGPQDPQNMALNFALLEPTGIRDIPVRHFDGADSWTFLD